MLKHNIFHKNNNLILIIVLLLIFYSIIREQNRPEPKIKAERFDSVLEMDYVKVEYEANVTSQQKRTVKEMKYILQWTPGNNVPFVYMGHGQQGFIERNCSFTNCYVTSDRRYLRDYTQFDVIVFSGPDLYKSKTDKYPIRNAKKLRLPGRRSPHQKYVFASIESAENYPICSEELDGYFNWTWTYKLDSDSRWGYFVVRDSEGKVVGPRRDMTWLKHSEMRPVSEQVRKILNGKTKTAAWFLSSCLGTHSYGVSACTSRREAFAKRLDTALEAYNLTEDVYGRCGDLKCERSKVKECDEMIEKDYFFYLSFENSLSDDYITEKLLHAVEYSTIPVVYGGANFTRFLPDGSYLDARKLGVKKLAAAMNALLQDREKYAEYFRWRNHYSYHRKSASPETDDYCGFCELLNNEKLVKKYTVYENFKDWWTPSYMC